MSADAEPSAWTFSCEPVPEGVRVTFLAIGVPFAVAILLTRDEARTFGDGMLAAAGDAYGRTFTPDKAGPGA